MSTQTEKVGPSPAPDPWPDGAHMRQWLEDQRIIIDGRMHLPTVEACEDLAGTANGMRWWISASRTEWRADRDRKKRVSDAVAILLDEIPRIIRDLELSLDTCRRNGSEIHARLMQPKLSAVKCLGSGLEAVKECPGLFLSVLDGFKDVDKWHDYGAELAEAFRAAARTTNPREPFVLSNHGPATRFLAAAIPHISGENPNTETIARYFQRNPG